MKNVLFGLMGLAAILLSVATLSKAACMGPYCWDDQGAYIAGYISDGNGDGLVVASSTTIVAIKPRAVGQLLVCSNCLTAYSLCVSTETANSKNAYVLVSTPTASCQ